MAAQNFRSAFNGFNREDVVHYIEYLNTKHAAEINQLQSDLELLQTQLDEAAQNPALQAQLAAVEAEWDGYRAQLEEAQATIAALEAEKTTGSDLADRCAQLENQLATAQTALSQSAAQELEAYRRAERTERLARERAEQVYRQANGALADATVKVDEAFAQIGALTDQVCAQLAQLQQAVSGSKTALADAAQTLYTIRPGSAQD